MGEQAVIVKEEEPEDLSLRTREVRMPIIPIPISKPPIQYQYL